MSIIFLIIESLKRSHPLFSSRLGHMHTCTLYGTHVAFHELLRVTLTVLWSPQYEYIGGCKKQNYIIVLLNHIDVKWKVAWIYRKCPWTTHSLKPSLQYFSVLLFWVFIRNTVLYFMHSQIQMNRFDNLSIHVSTFWIFLGTH